jgi:hypothetical protein
MLDGQGAIVRQLINGTGLMQGRLPRTPVLQPQEHEADRRNQDVGVENYSSIAGRDIAGADCLLNVAAGRAEQNGAPMTRKRA